MSNNLFYILKVEHSRIQIFLHQGAQRDDNPERKEAANECRIEVILYCLSGFNILPLGSLGTYFYNIAHKDKETPKNFVDHDLKWTFLNFIHSSALGSENNITGSEPQRKTKYWNLIEDRSRHFTKSSGLTKVTKKE